VVDVEAVVRFFGDLDGSSRHDAHRLGELIGVSGAVAGQQPVFAQRATEQLAMCEAKMVAREREAATDEARMREWSERLRHCEDELEARGHRDELASQLV